MPPKETALAQYKTDFSSGNELWLRITAFLSLKSANTQRTYAAVISEWCNFLGAEAGSEKAAKLLVKASDMAAVAYRASLEKKEGQKPRYMTSSSSQKSKIKAIQKQSFYKAKKDGMQSTLANATIRKKIAALRRIYRMLVTADLGVRINPFDTDRIPPPSASSGQKRPTEMVDFKLVKKIISLPNEMTDKGLRDKALLAVLFGGGLRRSEAVNLRLNDVRISLHGTSFLNLRATKSKRDFDQALPRWSSDIVKKLVNNRRVQGAKDGDFLFISYRGKGGAIPTHIPLSDSGVYKLFKFYCLKAGAGNFVTPHSARATAITKLLEDGLSHREVQEFSRHASVQMVEVYDKRRISVDESAAKDLKYD
jgi:integrase/recombinase XerD